MLSSDAQITVVHTPYWNDLSTIRRHATSNIWRELCQKPRHSRATPSSSLPDLHINQNLHLEADGLTGSQQAGSGINMGSCDSTNTSCVENRCHVTWFTIPSDDENDHNDNDDWYLLSTPDSELSQHDTSASSEYKPLPHRSDSRSLTNTISHIATRRKDALPVSPSRVRCSLTLEEWGCETLLGFTTDLFSRQILSTDDSNVDNHKFENQTWEAWSILSYEIQALGE